MSFTDLLADNGNNFTSFDNFDFIHNSSNTIGHLWEPYESTDANSSGEDFLVYNDRGISRATHLSSEQTKAHT